MGAAALLDTGSNSSVNTCVYDQTRYCLSAAYAELTEAPVFGSGRCYSYLSLTDFGLTGHLNSNDKIQNTAFFPLATALRRHSSALACLTVLRETTSTVEGQKVHSPWPARVCRAFPALTLPSGSLVLVLLPAQLELRKTAGGLGQLLKRSLQPVLGFARPQFARFAQGTWLCRLQHSPALRVLSWDGPAQRAATLPELLRASLSIDSTAADCLNECQDLLEALRSAAASTGPSLSFHPGWDRLIWVLPPRLPKTDCTRAERLSIDVRYLGQGQRFQRYCRWCLLILKPFLPHVGFVLFCFGCCFVFFLFFLLCL